MPKITILFVLINETNVITIARFIEHLKKSITSLYFSILLSIFLWLEVNKTQKQVTKCCQWRNKYLLRKSSTTSEKVYAVPGYSTFSVTCLLQKQQHSSLTNQI